MFPLLLPPPPSSSSSPLTTHNPLKCARLIAWSNWVRARVVVVWMNANLTKARISVAEWVARKCVQMHCLGISGVLGHSTFCGGNFLCFLEAQVSPQRLSVDCVKTYTRGAGFALIYRVYRSKTDLFFLLRKVRFSNFLEKIMYTPPWFFIKNRHF